jgi:hypothetical protein
MADALNITGIPQAQVSAPAGSAVSAANAVSANTNSNNINNNFSQIDTSPQPATDNSNPGISPRIVVDPLAGVITQFLSQTGQVESQIPSTTVVAYLRAGLEADGQSKNIAAPHADHKTASGDTSTGVSTYA